MKGLLAAPYLPDQLRHRNPSLGLLHHPHYLPTLQKLASSSRQIPPPFLGPVLPKTNMAQKSQSRPDVAIDFVNKKFRAELAAYQKQQPGVLELSAGIQLKPGFWPLSCGAIFCVYPVYT